MVNEVEQPESARCKGRASSAARSLRIALVGPCASGKSTLQVALEQKGYTVRHVAQEHSYVPNMWQRLSRPDILIFLDVDLAAVQARRPHQDGGPEWLATQQQRLAHARAHCHFYLDTSQLTREEVRDQVLDFLGSVEGS